MDSSWRWPTASGPTMILMGATSLGSHAGPLMNVPMVVVESERWSSCIEKGIPADAATPSLLKISTSLSLIAIQRSDDGPGKLALIATPGMRNEPTVSHDFGSQPALWNAMDTALPKNGSELLTSTITSTLVPANSFSFSTNPPSGLAFSFLGSLNCSSASCASTARALASAISERAWAASFSSCAVRSWALRASSFAVAAEAPASAMRLSEIDCVTPADLYRITDDANDAASAKRLAQRHRSSIAAPTDPRIRPAIPTTLTGLLPLFATFMLLFVSGWIVTIALFAAALRKRSRLRREN